MKIVIVAPSLQLGGLENSVAVMANYLAAKGHSVSLLLCYRLERFYAIDERIDVVEPPFCRWRQGKLAFYGRWVAFLRRNFRQIRPDIVLSYGDFHNALVLTAAKADRLPVVIADRASPGLEFPIAIRWLRRKMYPGAAGILAQTARAASSQRRIAGASVPVQVIPNPIRSFPAIETGHRDRVVLAAARHYHVKGLDRLVEAFAQVQAEHWELHVAGSEGPATEDLQQLVQKRGLSKRVRFLGSVRDMERLYAKAGLFVLPSRSEGFPNALIEAMSFGCPSIAFDINAGPADIIDHGVNGLLVADGDVAEFAHSMQWLIDDDALRRSLGSEAKKLKEELSVERIGSRVEEFLALVLRPVDGGEAVLTVRSR